MTRYQVYANRWDDPAPIEEIPARDLEFSMPLSEHGECSFTATVEPGWTGWRQAITKDISGVLVARDGVPWWQGWVVSEEETGDRTFSFRAIEWGYFFSAVPAVPKSYTDDNDGYIFRNLIDLAQVISGQDVQVNTGSVTGAAFSDRNIKAWEDKTVEGEFRSVAEPDTGPEWYFGTTGTLEVPVRQLYLGDRLGLTTAQTVLEFVEDMSPAATPDGVSTVMLLGDLFPGSSPVVPTRRAGGNVIAKRRVRQGESATVAVAMGNGQEAAQLRGTATSTLLSYGWPRMTRTKSYDINGQATLNRHAQGNLRAAEGFATGYSLVTLDDDPDWTDVPRGSTVRVSIDTDVYAGPRPLEFDTRLLNLTVRVPDVGPAQVQWDVATVQET